MKKQELSSLSPNSHDGFNYDKQGRLTGYNASISSLSDASRRKITFNYDGRGQLINEIQDKYIDPAQNTTVLWKKMDNNYDLATGTNLIQIIRSGVNGIISSPDPLVLNTENRILPSGPKPIIFNSYTATDVTDYEFNKITGNPTMYNKKRMVYDAEDRLIKVLSVEKQVTNIINEDSLEPDSIEYVTESSTCGLPVIGGYAEVVKTVKITDGVKTTRTEATYFTPQMTCGYYPDGKRAWKQTGDSGNAGLSSGARTYYLYDGDKLLCEVKQGYYVTAVNLWGADGLEGRVTKISTGTTPNDTSLINPETQVLNYSTSWYTFDQQGTLAQRFDADGNIVNTFVCDAFGNTLAGETETYSYNAKSGYYYDAEIGMYYCWHRYYDPANGRWLTEDPIGYEGGLNLYGYCGNLPVGRVDARGKVWQIVGIGIILIAGAIIYVNETDLDKARRLTKDEALMVQNDLRVLKQQIKLYINNNNRNTFHGCVSVDIKKRYVYIQSPIYGTKKVNKSYPFIGKYNVIMTLNVNDIDRKSKEFYSTFKHGVRNSKAINNNYIILGEEDYWGYKKDQSMRLATLTHELLHYDTTEKQETININEVGGKDGGLEHYDAIDKGNPKYKSYGDVEHCALLFLWLINLRLYAPGP